MLTYLAPLADYQHEAEALLADVKSGKGEARWRFKWLHPHYRGKTVHAVDAATLDLADAQRVVAATYKFDTWTDVVAFTDAVRHDEATARFEAAADAVVAGDLHALTTMLLEHPELARARSRRGHHATLLHYVAANGVEDQRQRTPPNIVEIAKTLLAAGAEADALADMYDATCTTMSMLVSSCHPANAGVQGALVETLLDHGAALTGPGSNWQSALMTALAFGYHDTAQLLARRGAPIESVAAAAGLGRLDDVRRLLPDADAAARHVALALAAHHGHGDVVDLLLDAGEDPNRYNPEGYHSHSTPLHQAALANQMDVVQRLVSRGARLDITDTIYGATPLDWALHERRDAIAAYLRERGAPTT